MADETEDRKIGGEPLIISLAEGKTFEFGDWGVAGVMIRLFDPQWPDGDREIGLMLPLRQSEALSVWLARLANREPLALPDQFEAVLRGLLARDDIDQLMPKQDRNILKDAVGLLKNLRELSESDSFNVRSKVQRALER